MGNAMELYQQVVERALEYPDFKAQLLSDPKGTLEECEFSFPPEVTSVRVVQDTADTIHFVLPLRRDERDNILIC